MNKMLRAWLIGLCVNIGIELGILVVNAIKDKYEEYQCKKLFKEIYGEIDGRTAA